LYPFGSAGSVKDRPADRSLQRSDLLAYGRLGIAKLGCGTAEGAFLVNSNKGCEVPELEVHYPQRYITLADQFDR
jgi:hypothetical protein